MEVDSASLNQKLINAILAISGSKALHEACVPLLDAALDLTNMEGGGVYSVNGEFALLQCHRGLPEPFIRQVARMPLNPPPVQTLLSLQEPIELAEISSAMKDLFRQHGIQHAFSFPLRGRSELFGFLNVATTQIQPPRNQDIRALHLLVRQMEDLFWRLHCEKALRESEERYRTLAESAHDFIFVLDTDGAVQYINQHGQDALGLRQEELVGRGVSDLFPPETAARQKENLRLVLESGESLVVVNRTPFQKRERWLMTQLTPMRDATGEIQGILGISRDITEQKKLEEELRRLNEDLENQVAQRTAELSERAGQLEEMTAKLLRAEEQERRRLAEILHNDLQQVLAAARFRLSFSGGRILNTDSVRQEIDEARNLLQEGVDKCRALSHELGPPALYRRNLNDIFGWLAQQMRVMHGLSVHLEVTGPIYSNSEEVKILLFRGAQEILFNIAKHAGVKEAEVRLQRVSNELELIISDKGTGFAPELAAGREGFGLLSIRERVEFLGGEMKIESSPGKGALLKITMPDSPSTAPLKLDKPAKNS